MRQFKDNSKNLIPNNLNKTTASALNSENKKIKIGAGALRNLMNSRNMVGGT